MAGFEDFLDHFPEEVVDDPSFRFGLSEMFDPYLYGDEWHNVYDGLRDYMIDQWDLDLEDFWDDAEYGEWYDATH